MDCLELNRRYFSFKVAVIVCCFVLPLLVCITKRSFETTIHAEEKEVKFQQVLTTDRVMSSGWGVSPFVVKEYKLLFWGIPKVGCTTWKFLFRRINGARDWNKQGDGLPHNPTKNGLLQLNALSPEEATRILNDPNWTKAIFVRDPKSRFLSAFMDKALRGHHIIRDCCKEERKDDVDQCMSDVTTLEGFLEFVQWCHNVHWEPQKPRVDEKYWQHMDYIGHLENLSQDGEWLLQKIGAWEKYGKTGWGPYGNWSMFHKPDQDHVTGSGSKMEVYYTPELERAVEEFYDVDYEFPLFNFTRKWPAGSLANAS